MELLLKVTQLLSVKAASGSCPPAFTSGQTVSALECDDPLMNKRWGGGDMERKDRERCGGGMLYWDPPAVGDHSTLSQRLAAWLGCGPPFPKLSLCVSGSIQAQQSFQEWP